MQYLRAICRTPLTLHRAVKVDLGVPTVGKDSLLCSSSASDSVLQAVQHPGSAWCPQ